MFLEDSEAARELFPAALAAGAAVDAPHAEQAPEPAGDDDRKNGENRLAIVCGRLVVILALVVEIVEGFH